MSDKRTSARHRSAARRRMAQTGEKYTVALAAVLADAKRGIDPQSTIVTGAPGYGFTAVAIEAMKARFPGESDEQIHARLIAEVEIEGFVRSIEDIENMGAMTKALVLAASNVSMFVGGVSLREQLETVRDALGHSGLERAKAVIDIARPKLSDADVRTLDSLVLTVNDARREANTAAARNNIEYALSTLDAKTIPAHLKEKLSRVLLGEDGLTRTRINGVPSRRLRMDAVYQIVAGAFDDESARVYLWSRDLGDFNELLEHYDGAERDEDALESLLASARTHGDEKVIVVIDHQGVLSHRSADLLVSLSRERKDIEIIYVEREFVDLRRRMAQTASARTLIATRLAPAQFGVFGTADRIIEELGKRGVRILRDQSYEVRPISEGGDNLAKSYVRDVIRLALIERGLRADSYDVAQHADAVIESLVATGLVSFSDEMLRLFVKVDPMGSSADFAEATGGTVVDLSDQKLDPLAGFETTESKGGFGKTTAAHDFLDDQSPHQTIIGLAGAGALKAPEYDDLFGRVVPLDIEYGSPALRAETKVYTDQNLPYITLDTGQRRRYAAAEAIDEYGVFTVVVTYEPDYYESSTFAHTIHPDDLTAEFFESPMIGYYVIDDVERAVEDLDGMMLISNLIATARDKGRAIRLLQSREKDVPAAIAGRITNRIKSEEPYGLIEAKTLVSLGSQVYGNVFDDETGIDFMRGSHLIVTGAAGSGKTVLLNKLANQMAGRGYEVNYCTQWSDYPLHADVRRALFSNEDMESPEWDEMIEHVSQTMIERQKTLAKHSLHVWHEADDMKPVFLFIDSATALEGENAKKVGRLLCKARSAGIFVVFAQQRVRVADIESVLRIGYQQFTHRIQMGQSSYADRVSIFSQGFEYDSEMTRGDGIYQDADGNIRHVHVPWVRSESDTDRP